MGGASFRTEPADARTSERLALALLGYFILITLVITLSPFDFGPARVRVSVDMWIDDVLLNIGLFLPLGFLLRSIDRPGTRRGWHTVATLAAFSVLIELTQVFIQSRYVSPIDVLANTGGACAGVYLRRRVERWTVWRPQVVGRIGLDIPLVGLVYLLVPQLWLSGMGLVHDAWRAVTTLLLACAGTIVLASLRRNRWNAEARALLSARRFEEETLQKFIPIFVGYLVVAALWQPFRMVGPWQGAVAFLDPTTSVGKILMLLEQVCGFTLLGYALAERRSRQEITVGADLPHIGLAGLLLAGVLEIAQGWLSGHGASLLRAALASGGAVYGAAVYHLARAHVRSLRRLQEAEDADELRSQAA
ncbi:MAG: VanZ family protein [Vicinamibacterales bacterium]